MNDEAARLLQARGDGVAWRRWGPYLSERQWGTVREDESSNGDAWNSFTHDQARSRAYRWGEDGIAGLSDDQQLLCLAIALWNGQDPILKERLFGLTNGEGNHGEDVKEYYFYLDCTPTHSYMRLLYKYPQVAFPYDDLIATNRGRNRYELEYELLDTGAFDDDRYWDVEVEYAKASPEDLVARITVHNRGPESAELHLIPTLWFRNTWWMGPEPTRPVLSALGSDAAAGIQATHPLMGDRYLVCDQPEPLLFTENESNLERLFGRPNPSPYVKDGINEAVVHGNGAAVNPAATGTKAAIHHRVTVLPNGSAHLRLRLSDVPATGPLDSNVVDELIARRRAEADEFYASITPPGLSADQASVFRQAEAGMLWSKQFYLYDVPRWLELHGVDRGAAAGQGVRNAQWYHLFNSDVISMPDKWEYPWYAAWDLAFHTTALLSVDPDLAKEQLLLVLKADYLHPNGQVPAYEWNFSDVNPPVQAWAAATIFSAERELFGHGDLGFLKEAFQKLLMNFTWWVNRKDAGGSNVFEGGFLGLDNIGVFDRSAPLPTGGYLEQADGTAWMAFFCQNMLQIALELAMEDPSYETMAVKFVEHFVWVAAAMNGVGVSMDGLWDEEDGFFYDRLRLPDGTSTPLKVRSVVGLIPLCASTVFPGTFAEKMPSAARHVELFSSRHPELFANLARLDRRGVRGRRLLSLVGEERLRRVLSRMLDEQEFLSPYGIRSLSRAHADAPYRFEVSGQEYRVSYEPAESTTGMFGGNSNWRGPVWMPINLLLLRALLNLYAFHGDEFRVECPTGSGNELTLFEVAMELGERLQRLFLRDDLGRRPVFGGQERLQTDPQWRDHLLFYEYFHGDNGAGLGASHQTGWTGSIARVIQMMGYLTPEMFLEAASPRLAYFQPSAAQPAAASSGEKV